MILFCFFFTRPPSPNAYGTIQKSKFDKDLEKIKELLGYKLSVRKIAKYMGYPNYISLNKYLNKRRIKEDVNNALKIQTT